LSKGIKLKLKILKSNLSDVRRRTPIETEKTLPLFSFLTILLPGLGQLLNKQYFKALLFSLVTLFIYFIAIPYALGYGNYQGDGISGLLSLAEGGRRIDKSLIFMIEGIVAIFLVLISLGLYAISFNDVYKTEKDIIKGIRPRNWFETLSKIEQDGFPYMVSAPALIVTIFIVLVPITTAILLSFTGMDPQNQSKFGWVGINNYKLIALGQGLAGSVFWSILTWTLIWTVVATSMAIATGFSLAILANNDRIKGKTFFRVVYLLPWAVPAFITIMFFSIMFSPNGALTTVIYDVFNVQVQVKNDATLSRITLIFLQTWLGSSYVFLLSTGVLQAIPGDLYEAAQIDGATAWQKLKRITLPIVLFQTAPLLVGQYTFNFNNFSIIYLFNGGGPFNPSKYGNLAGSTDLLISYIYKLTMENQYQSIGAAITIVISMGLMLFAFIGFKNSKAFREERL
jgi:arabinogalactan oligomer/maltooligosaccharide transport system permease protein